VSLPPVVFILMQVGASADGGVSSISQIIDGLQKHRPIIVTDRNTPRLDRWRNRGVEVHVVSQAASRGLSRAPVQVLASYARYTAAVRRILRRSGARVVHANDPMAFQLAMTAVKTTPGAKIVLNLRDTLDPARSRPTRRYSFLFQAADHVFYLSQDMADRWTEVAPNAKRAYSVTYSVVDREQFPPAPAPTESPRVVLLSGVIWPKKGQLEFLAHISPFLGKRGIATWLAGDFDPERDDYTRACAEAAAPLGEMVRFLGYRSDMSDLIARSSVIAIASRHEGLVRAMIEAMSRARPVVSFAISSAREILEEQSRGAGRVFEVGDYEGMRQAILEYCEDERLAAAAGAKGSSTAARLFAAKEVIARYERVYEQLRQPADHG
jgi:glycosyltransferase involved in cell wall biosynthesis